LSKLKAPEEDYDWYSTPNISDEIRGGGESERACGTHGKENCMYYFDGRMCRKEITFEYLGVNCRIMLIGSYGMSGGGVNWIHLALDRHWWRVIESAVTTFQVA
jgi:hypothetical protein